MCEQGGACSHCRPRSFGARGDSDKVRCWLTDKNGGVSPYDVSQHSHVKYWFTCSKCTHDFEISLSKVNRDPNPQWCPYCANLKRCTRLDCTMCTAHSFAGCTIPGRVECWNQEKNGGKNPRDVALNSNDKYWFTCSQCTHEFEVTLNHVNHKSNPQWCPYCANLQRCARVDCSMCVSHSFAGCTIPGRVECWNQEKNDGQTPRDVALNSNDKYWFTCSTAKCGYQFKIALNTINAGKWCRFCRQKTECILRVHLRTRLTSYTVSTQYQFDWSNWRYDFHLVNTESQTPSDVLIELDGDQHFSQVSNWQSNVFTRQRDVDKMQLAVRNHHHILRLYQVHVFDNRFDWQTKLNSALLWLETQFTATILYMSMGTSLYKDHIADMSGVLPHTAQWVMNESSENTLIDSTEQVCRSLLSLNID